MSLREKQMHGNRARVRERRRKKEGRKEDGGKSEKDQEPRERSRKREKGATKNKKKSGSPLRSERLGAGGLEQVITSGCGGDAVRAGPS